MTIAWIPFSFGFIFMGLTEAVLPFRRTPLFHMWLWKILLPLGALFIHEMVVPFTLWSGQGLVQKNFVWAGLLIMLVYGTHFDYWVKERAKQVYRSNVHMLLQYLNFSDRGKENKLLLKDSKETKNLRTYLMNVGDNIGWENANTVLLNMAVANVIRYPT
jgi:hypothetical protein